MAFSQPLLSLSRALALLSFLVLACASSSGSDGAVAPDADQPEEFDCGSLTTCDDGQACSDGAPCFKLKRCPGFVCAATQAACNAECGAGANCLVLESQPMLIGCR
jgi:hypothetical protein